MESSLFIILLNSLPDICVPVSIFGSIISNSDNFIKNGFIFIVNFGNKCSSQSSILNSISLNLSSFLTNFIYLLQSSSDPDIVPFNPSVEIIILPCVIFPSQKAHFGQVPLHKY